MAHLDPATSERTIAYAARRFLRRHLGPKHQAVPELLAKAIADHLRISGWRFVKLPPDPWHSDPGPSHDAVLRKWREDQAAAKGAELPETTEPGGEREP